MNRFEQIIDKIFENLVWAAFTFIAIAVASIWAIFQNDLSAWMLIDAPRSIQVLGLIIVILTITNLLMFAYLSYLRKRITDPFKGFDIDQNSGIAVHLKTKAQYCSSCLSKGRRVRVVQEKYGWYCLDRDCKNSSRPAAISSF